MVLRIFWFWGCVMRLLAGFLRWCLSVISRFGLRVFGFVGFLIRWLYSGFMWGVVAGLFFLGLWLLPFGLLGLRLGLG